MNGYRPEYAAKRVSICSIIENIPPKGVGFSDFICTFAMSFRVLSDCLATPKQVRILIWQIAGQFLVTQVLVRMLKHNVADSMVYKNCEEFKKAISQTKGK